MEPSSPLPLMQPPDPAAEKRLAEVREKLRKLDRRDWWLWSLAVVVMFLLTFAVFSMSFPDMIKVDDPFFAASLNRAVRGLVGLVLIFNAYTIYQQVTVKRLRRQFSGNLDDMRTLQIRSEEFQRLALVDSLTGLSNRRLAADRLASEASRSQRYGSPLTVVALDLDKFKHINDTYGHAAGDLVLKEFGGRISSAIRLSDFAARMGGDEFLVVLPECTISQVAILLARLRPMEIVYAGQKIPVFFSAGCVGYEKGETPEQFLERADRTLYMEKRARKSNSLEEEAVPAHVTVH